MQVQTRSDSGEKAASFTDLSRMLGAARTALETGSSVPHALGLGDEDVNSAFAIADELCAAGRFGEALPHAMKLVLCDSKDHRYLFLAGECLEFESTAPRCTEPQAVLAQATAM